MRRSMCVTTRSAARESSTGAPSVRATAGELLVIPRVCDRLKTVSYDRSKIRECQPKRWCQGQISNSVLANSARPEIMDVWTARGGAVTDAALLLRQPDTRPSDWLFHCEAYDGRPFHETADSRIPGVHAPKTGNGETADRLRQGNVGQWYDHGPRDSHAICLQKTDNVVASPGRT